MELRISSSIFILSALLMTGACVKDNGHEPLPPEQEKPTEPTPQKPEPKEVHVVSTDYSIGGDIYDRDTLFVHFDGKITYSTIPHYDWITYTDYYYPEERIILDDTTLALVFDGHQAFLFGQENEFSFTVTCEDGTETPVKVSIPFYHHLIVTEGDVRQISLYNDFKEIIYMEGNSRKLVRMDYLTGEIVREYDLSGLPGEQITYTPNRYNGLIYLWCTRYGYIPYPDIYVLDPDSGELRVALTIPEDPRNFYQYQQPYGINFTKYGTGLVTLVNKEITGSYPKIVRTQPDGTLTMEDISRETGGDYWTEFYEFCPTYFFPVAVSLDGTYVMCSNETTHYIVFEGETCRLQLGPSTMRSKYYMTPHLKDGSWYMREIYQQFILYPDGTTSPKWYHDTRHRGGADFCYTPGYEHLVMVFDDEWFHNDPSKVTFYDTRTGEMVFCKYLSPNMKSFMTTPDGKYGIMHCNSGDVGTRYGDGKVLIFVYDMPDLLSHIRYEPEKSAIFDKTN